MAPPHVSIIQHFNNHTSNHVEASVAFGLFMQSEKEWAAKFTKERGIEPSDGKYRSFHSGLTDHEIARYLEGARRILNENDNKLVESKRSEFLQQSLLAYRTAASNGHRGFRRWGIIEATIGALLWAILLIGLSIIATRNGIDILETYQKAAGYSQHQTPARPTE